MKFFLILLTLSGGFSLDSNSDSSPRKLHVIPDGTLPVLIWWTEHIFPHNRKENLTHKIQCNKGPCLTTIDRKLLNQSNSQAFLFYGTEFRANDVPLPRFPWQHWALFHEESPKNNWIFSHEECIKLFNYTATFSPKSDYPVTSQFITDVNDWFERAEINTIEKNRLEYEEGLAPVVYIQRDCNPPSDRDNYVKELMKYIKIDSYGPCLNNKKLPKNLEGFHNLDSEDFHNFLARYKFHLAFENAICDGYMTEKLFRPLKVGSVPVYFGSPSVLDWMPNENSVILVSDFANPKQLGRFLTAVNEDDDTYNSYLVYKHPDGLHNRDLVAALEQRPWKVLGDWDKVNFGHRMYAGYECYICDELYKWNNTLGEYLENPGKALPPAPRFANNSHLGCPEPRPSISIGKQYPANVPYREGLKEAKALYEMVSNGETDSNSYLGKYLKINTDKYQLPKDEL